ncbi:ATP-binding cassette domain-containing protein [Sanguibacter sp. 25GB23B1]|uniref:ABC transporter ATP-binding protein n=1 Tax=unclassified Sanguibacter TaxID=2645534 RepID=UPI0032B01C4B
MTHDHAPDPRHVPIVADGLAKSFGPHDAVRGVTFSVRRGRITGFLGPNGAGKTTTLRMILGLCRPTRGTALVDGVPYADLTMPSTVVGAALESNAFTPGQSGYDHLWCYAPAAGASASRIDELLALVGLTDAARRPVNAYSLGMKQRLALATALLGDPEILVLDEPANGLDPQGIVWLRQFLRSFADAGGTVLLSSHMLAEVEQMVDDIVLVDHGLVVYDGPVGGLVTSGDACVVRGPGIEVLARVLDEERLDVVRTVADGLRVRASANTVTSLALAHGLDLGQLQISSPSLETAFLDLTHQVDGEVGVR